MKYAVSLAETGSLQV